jgi:CheY-like chemotaxis protein
MMPKKILSIGQCVPDHGSISRFLQSNFDVQIEKCDTAPAAIDRLRQQPFDLVLINRKLDSDYTDGVEILRTIKADAQLAATPVMLVSNYPEHQENAVALGAEYGFGKAELGSSDVVARLEPFLVD